MNTMLHEVTQLALQHGLRVSLYHAGSGVEAITLYPADAEIGGDGYTHMIGPDGDTWGCEWGYDVYDENQEFVDERGEPSRMFTPANAAEVVAKIERLAGRITGETTGRIGDDTTRVPINIDADVQTPQLASLYQPWMRGVGYSEFIDRAINAAYREREAS